jgi:hypothetical protein
MTRDPAVNQTGHETPAELVRPGEAGLAWSSSGRTNALRYDLDASLKRAIIYP